MIVLEGFAVRYPGAVTPALTGISLGIDEGAFVVVAGDSGSGKSTFARALVGLVPHFSGGQVSGRILVAGRDTRDTLPRALADVCGFVDQDPEAQAVVDRVEDEIVFAMENLGVEPLTMRARLEEILDAIGLAHLRARRLSELSGGERQRVAIAAALASHPRCLVLDEPTSQLDPQSAEDVLGVLHRLNADLGIAIVLVEHRLERVVQHADRLIVLDAGRVVADGAPRAVLAGGAVSTPLSRLARALGWQEVPLTVREGRAFAASLHPLIPPTEPVRLSPGEELVRARGLRVARGGVEVLRGVDVAVARGETLAIVGRNGSGKTTLVRTLMGLLHPHAGHRVVAGMDPAAVPLERIASRVAYVPQVADSLLFHDTVRDEVRFTLAARDPSGDADEVIERAGMSVFASADPRDLSAGERLRAALLAATAGDPDLVILDEPTRGMDARGKELLAREIDGWRVAGRATILVTHDAELVARTATRALMLSDGEVVLDGPVSDALGGSALFGSQMTKVFGDPRILTLEDALEAVGAR